MNARDELAPMVELDAHRPTHSEYTGGWWELACTGCDFAKGRRLSHLDWAPHQAHREEVFLEALAAAGYRRPRVVTTVAELDALPEDSIVLSSTVFLRARSAYGQLVWGCVGSSDLLTAEDVFWASDSATVLHEPEAS